MTQAAHTSLTTIGIALIGLVGSLGGAWIMTGATFQEQFDQVKDDYKAILDNVDTLKEQTAAAKQQLSHVEKRLELSIDDFEDLQAQADEQINELERTIDIQIERSAAAQAQSKQQLTALREQVQATEATAKQATDALAQQMAKANDTISELQAKLDQIDASTDRAETRVAGIQKSIELRQVDLRALRQEAIQIEAAAPPHR